MENNLFEQVIDLEDKPSVRRKRTPEMEEAYIEKRPNSFFSIEEEPDEDSKTAPGRRKCIFLVASAFGVLTVVVLLLCFLGPLKSKTDGISSSSVGDKKKVDQKGGTIKHDGNHTASSKTPIAKITLPPGKPDGGPSTKPSTKRPLLSYEGTLRTRERTRTTSTTVVPEIKMSTSSLHPVTEKSSILNTIKTTTVSSFGMPNTHGAERDTTVLRVFDSTVLTSVVPTIHTDDGDDMDTTVVGTVLEATVHTGLTTTFGQGFTATNADGMDSTVRQEHINTPTSTDISQRNANIQTTLTTFSTSPSPSCPPVSVGRTSGCLTSLTDDCHLISGCQTTTPNRYGYGNTPSKVASFFGKFKMLLQSFACHSRSNEFLCAILNPPCDHSMIGIKLDGDYAFDAANIPQRHIPVPCKSLCDHIGDECLGNINEEAKGGFYDLCQQMPESSSEYVCFGGISVTDSTCNPNPCLNGGVCFTHKGREYCKCNSQFHGILCEHENETSFNISKDACVSVPNECRSLLPYNETSGISLKDTDRAYIASWDTIATVATRDNTTKKLFCALIYPQCRSEGTVNYIVCSDYCGRVKPEVEFLLAAVDFPSLDCYKTIRNDSLPEGMKCIS